MLCLTLRLRTFWVSINIFLIEPITFIYLHPKKIRPFTKGLHLLQVVLSLRYIKERSWLSVITFLQSYFSSDKFFGKKFVKLSTGFLKSSWLLPSLSFFSYSFSLKLPATSCHFEMAGVRGCSIFSAKYDANRYSTKPCVLLWLLLWVFMLFQIYFPILATFNFHFEWLSVII
jgi:hypothetical protein